MGEPKSLLAASSKIVHEFDPNLPLESPITQREQFDQSISRERLIARLSIAFAGLAMFLVVVGLYGTVSYTVNRRTIEIGLRLALGASHREVLGMILRESMLLALAGIGIGLPIAFVAARTLRSMLFGLSAADPSAWIAALGGIALVTLAAALLPALRAQLASSETNALCAAQRVIPTACGAIRQGLYSVHESTILPRQRVVGWSRSPPAHSCQRERYRSSCMRRCARPRPCPCLQRL